MKRGRWGARRTDRDQRAAQVLEEAVKARLFGRSLLIIDEPDANVDKRLSMHTGTAVKSWSRLSTNSRRGQSWPDDGLVDACALRMPRSKVALTMSLAAAASKMEPKSDLWVYGANDEGIRSVQKHFEPFFSNAATVLTKRHCRVWNAQRTDIVVEKSTLADWRILTEITFPGFDSPWVSYPGIFAKGGLDAGTKLLLEGLSSLPEPRKQVLDFACGSGVIASAMATRWPHLVIHGCDADAVALEATAENSPGTILHLSDRFRDVPALTFDSIVSNPPIHWGKDEDHSILSDLIQSVPSRIVSGGTLFMVVQREVPLHGVLKTVFQKVEVVSENARFRVWLAQ